MDTLTKIDQLKEEWFRLAAKESMGQTPQITERLDAIQKELTSLLQYEKKLDKK